MFVTKLNFWGTFLESWRHTPVIIIWSDPPHTHTHTPTLPPGNVIQNTAPIGWLCWGLTSQSTIFQSCRDGAIASWVINQYFRGVKCLAQGHNTAEVGLEPRTSRSGVRRSTTEPPRSPPIGLIFNESSISNMYVVRGCKWNAFTFLLLRKFFREYI